MGKINDNLPPDASNTIGYPIVKMDPKKCDVMSENQGVRVRVWKTTICPNVKRIDSAEHELNCTVCNSKLFIDRQPIETWAFLQNQGLNKNFQNNGEWDDKMVLATFKRDTEIYYFSKIELMDFSTVYSEMVQRQEGTIDHLKYPALSCTLLIDKNGVEYTSGVDFEINTDGDVEWIGSRPSRGVIYSCYYNYRMTYRSVQAMHINRFGQNKNGSRHTVEFPFQWMLKLDFLLQKEDITGSPLFANKILEV